MALIPIIVGSYSIFFAFAGVSLFLVILFEMVRKSPKYLHNLHVIDHGHHSFQITKKSLYLIGISDEKLEECTVASIAMFVSQNKNEKLIIRSTISLYA